MTLRIALVGLAFLAPALAQEKEQQKATVELGKALLAAEKERPLGTRWWALEEKGQVRRVLRLSVELEQQKGWTTVALTDNAVGEGKRSTARVMTILDEKGATHYVSASGKGDGESVTLELNIDAKGAEGLRFSHGKERREPEKLASEANPRGIPAAVVPLLLASLARSLPAEGTVEVISEDCQKQRATPFTSKKEGAAVVIALDGKEVARVEDGKLVRLQGLAAKEIDEATARKHR